MKILFPFKPRYKSKYLLQLKSIEDEISYYRTKSHIQAKYPIETNYDYENQNDIDNTSADNVKENLAAINVNNEEEVDNNEDEENENMEGFSVKYILLRRI